jgi:hypothetical protein
MTMTMTLPTEYKKHSQRSKGTFLLVSPEEASYDGGPY